MRTTVSLDDDVAAAVEQLRRVRSIGLSQALNELVRVGLASEPRRRPFVQRTAAMGPARIDLTCVAEAIEAVDGPGYR